MKNTTQENNTLHQTLLPKTDILEKEIEKENIEQVKYFSVSTTKLVVMSVTTLGLYEFYWFYKNWKAIKKAEHHNISPFWRGLFSIIFCHNLFEHITASFLKQENKKLFSPVLLALAYIFLFILERIVGDSISYLFLLFISSLTIVPLWKAQETIDMYNTKIDEKYKPENIFSEFEIMFAVLGSLLVYIGFIA